MIRLYLIRHAKAAERGPDYPDDSQRPLVQRGQKQARALAKTLEGLEVRFDRLYSSPHVRAWQTAKALRDYAEEGAQELLALTGDDYRALLGELDTDLADGQKLALVGHEPYLSELASWLLTGSTHTLRIDLKKAGVLVLVGPLQKGEMTLAACLAPKHYRRRV